MEQRLLDGVFTWGTVLYMNESVKPMKPIFLDWLVKFLDLHVD